MVYRLGSVFTLFVFLWACEDPEKQLSKEIEQLREVHHQHHIYRIDLNAALKWKDSVQRRYKGTSIEKQANFLNEFNYFFTLHYKDHNDILQKIDSVTQTSEYISQPPINKFYVNFLAARIAADAMKTEESFDYSILALQELEGQEGEYHYERKKIKDMILMALGMFVDIEDMELESLLLDYQNQLNEGDKGKDNAVRAAYYLAYHYQIFKNDYPTALEWVDKAFEIEPNLANNHLISELLTIKGEAYKELGNKKEVLRIFDRVQKEYERGHLSKEKWYEFQSSYKGVLVGIVPNAQLIEEINALIDYFGYSCEERYYLYQLQEPLAQLYQKEGNLEKELETLNSHLYYVSECNDFNEMYRKSERNTLERLFVLNLKLGKKQESEKILTRLNELDKNLDQSKELFVKLDNYFKENQLTYLDNLEALEIEKEKTDAKQKMAYILIAIILLITIVFVKGLISKNKKIQKDLKMKNDELDYNNEKIDQQNRELVSLISTLEESNHNLQKFAKLAAEDIQSPIKQITNDIEEISTKYRKILLEEDQEIVDFLKESTEQLIEMIETLLQYAGNEQEIVADEEVNIERKIEIVKNNLLDEIIKSKATINYPENIPTVYANSAMVGQLFQNLISNALKFGSPDRPLRIDISFKEINPNEIQIAIKDNGVGIKEEDQNEIFKVFKKIESVENYQGSGIGLSTCKKIVENFGGEIWVESEWGVGSTFYFTLPTVKPDREMKTDTIFESA